MRTAILTDIHANRAALDAVLADVAARGVERIVLLGDIVGYGPDPEWCVTKARALQDQGALVIRGNHDEAVLIPDPQMSTNARVAIDWTRPRLDRDQARWLADLPMAAEAGEVLYTHASPQDPGGWIYLDGEIKAVGAFKASAARVTVCGHVHRPQLYSRDLTGTVRQTSIPFGKPLPLIRSRRWVAVVGAVGQPRDGNPAASYALFDDSTAELTFRRVPYDIAATVAGLRAAGLPEKLAQRLMNGA